MIVNLFSGAVTGNAEGSAVSLAPVNRAMKKIACRLALVIGTFTGTPTFYVHVEVGPSGSGPFRRLVGSQVYISSGDASTNLDIQIPFPDETDTHARVVVSGFSGSTKCDSLSVSLGITYEDGYVG